MSVDLAISLLIALINHSAEISAAITKAKTEKRDLTDEEVQLVFDSYALARAKLDASLASKGK